MTANKDYVFAGNAPYESVNENLARGDCGFRIGPVIDPHSGEYMPLWQGLVGLYELDNEKCTPGEASVVRDSNGRKITLESALEKAGGR